MGGGVQPFVPSYRSTIEVHARPEQAWFHRTRIRLPYRGLMSTICVVLQLSECSLLRLCWLMWRLGVSFDEYGVNQRVFMLEFSRSTHLRGVPARERHSHPP